MGETFGVVSGVVGAGAVGAGAVGAGGADVAVAEVGVDAALVAVDADTAALVLPVVVEVSPVAPFEVVALLQAAATTRSELARTTAVRFIRAI